VASQEFIKQWGTNGGGFFNANSAHPYENPTPLTNFIAMFSIFAISAGLTWTLGSMTGSRGHGWAVWGAMAFLFMAGATIAYWAEARGNPLLAGADQQGSLTQPGGNMEGKDVRFGIANSALLATVGEPRAPRVLRGALYLCIGHREQRVRLRGYLGQYALVQHIARPRHAVWTVPDHHPGARAGR